MILNAFQGVFTFLRFLTMNQTKKLLSQLNFQEKPSWIPGSAKTSTFNIHLNANSKTYFLLPNHPRTCHHLYRSFCQKQQDLTDIIMHPADKASTIVVMNGAIPTYIASHTIALHHIFPASSNYVTMEKPHLTAINIRNANIQNKQCLTY